MADVYLLLLWFSLIVCVCASVLHWGYVDDVELDAATEMKNGGKRKLVDKMSVNYLLSTITESDFVLKIALYATHTHNTNIIFLHPLPFVTLFYSRVRSA